MSLGCDIHMCFLALNSSLLGETERIEGSGIQVIFLFPNSGKALAKSSSFGRLAFVMGNALSIFQSGYFSLPPAGNRRVFLDSLL